MIDVHAVLFDYGHTLADFTLAEDNLLECYAEVRLLLENEAKWELPEAAELVESVSSHVSAAVSESYGRQELQELDIVSLFEDALRRAGYELPRDLVLQIAEMEHRALIGPISVPEENLEVLRVLADRGMKLGLVSNATLLPHMMHADINRLGLGELLDAAVFSSEVGVRKPHAAIFEHVLDAVGVPPDRAVFVGDRLHDDIGGAQALGMHGILTRQYRQEDPSTSPIMPYAVIERLPDLLPVLEPPPS